MTLLVLTGLALGFSLPPALANDGATVIATPHGKFTYWLTITAMITSVGVFIWVLAAPLIPGMRERIL
jgi:hypothetical protein